MASAKSSGIDPAWLVRECEQALDAAEDAESMGRFDLTLYERAAHCVKRTAPNVEHHVAARLRDRMGGLGSEPGESEREGS